MEKEDFREISYEEELQRANGLRKTLRKVSESDRTQNKENLSNKEFERRQSKIDSAFFRAVHTCAGTSA